ncbi:hypothetical protein U9M48_001421 [Paspalum notatum var. saurae]|uniref:Uncharacterized protein n=1 Tax=Paspalum notatum var. saurae TaxID=547442 RepID=A0AAQ3PI55_PASNO
MASLGRLKSAIFDREERKMQYQSHIRGLNAYDRHKKFMKDYAQFYGYEKDVDNSAPIKTDKDTLREGYRFILSEEDDMDSTWERRLVKHWIEMENRKGGDIWQRSRVPHQLRSLPLCSTRAWLKTVNFSYVEAGEQKQALVKLVACKRCAEKLAYKRQKEKEKEKENELSGAKEIELNDKDKRKRQL